MNKNLFILALFFFSISSYAQVINTIGIKSGMAITNQNEELGGYRMNSTIRTGFYGGISLEMFKSRYFSFTTDLGYIQKGKKDQWEISTPDQPEGTGKFKTMDHRFDFLTLTPAAKFRKSWGKFAPYIFAGPRLDYYLGYKSETDYSQLKTNDFIFGLSYGLGLEYTCHQLIFSLEGTHQPDFTRFVNQNASDKTMDHTILNRAFLFTLGLKYKLD